jgi:predicted metal-binding membrane protein
MQQAASLELILRRDRVVVKAGLIVLVTLAWSYTVYLSRNMRMMSTGMDMEMAFMPSWGAPDFAAAFVMWAVMMTAMMVPSAAPMILLFANIQRKREAAQRPFVPTSVFVMGYLVIWYGFATLAVVGQWSLHTVALLSPQLASTSPYLGGALLVAAGLFQWSRLKSTCLSRCRGPLGFLMTEWREEKTGAFIMGLRHGMYCLGCCWVLMALLFVLGVMNLLWIAVLAAFVLIEKLAPAGQWVGRLTGIVLVGWGAWMILSELS